MVDEWFGADFHFFHKKILTYAQEYRPFADITAHNAKLIENYNSVVKPNDKMTIIGDFFVGDCTEEEIEDVMMQLNGVIEVVEGNHDSRFKKKVFGKYVKNITAYKTIRSDKYDSIVSHMPIHPEQLETRYRSCVHGHMHSTIITRKQEVRHNFEVPISTLADVPDPRYICVSMEQIGLTPIHRDIIMQRIKDAII